MKSLIISIFSGSEPRNPVAVRVKGLKKPIIIAFGDIRVPAVKDLSPEKLKELEDFYSCRIRRVGDKYVIIPKVVEEIIKRDGVLASMCEEHRKALREWYEGNADVIAELLKGGV